MPSGEIVEIDLADNDVAILDSSACALATAASSSSSDSGSSNPKVSQSQGEEGEAQEVEEVSVHQVSPMPKRSSAVTITPRAMRKKTGGTSKGKGKASTKKKVTNNNNNSSPATPPPNAHASRTSEAVAVATPGDGSATKKKKDAANTNKKPSATLHSFFAKADPSAKKKKTKTTVVGGVTSSNGGVKVAVKQKTATATAAKAKASSTATATASVVADKKKEGTGEKSTSEELPAKPTVAKKPAAKEADKKSVSEELPAKSAKKAAVKETSNDKAKKKRAPKKTKGETQTAGAEKNTTVAKKIAKKPIKKNVAQAPASDNHEELDDSPMYALAMAMRGRRRNSGGKKKIASDVEAKETVEVVDLADDSVADKVEMDDINPVPVDSSNDAVDKDEESNISNTAEVTDSVEQETDAIEVDESEGVGDTLPLGGTKDSIATASNEVLDVDVKKTCAVEETAHDDAINVHEDDATVSLEEGAAEKSTVPKNVSTTNSDVPAEISMEVEPSEEDEIVVVEVTKKSVLEELPTEGNNAEEASNDEVVVVDAPKDTVEKSSNSKKKTVKSSIKPGKKPAAASANKSKKKKASSPALAFKTKKISPIAASFKKLAACSPKKSNGTTPKTLPPSCSTTASSKSESKSDAASSASAKPTADKEDVNIATAAPIANLSEENASRLRHYTTLREKYVTRATELGNRPNSNDFQEENLSLKSASELPALEKGSVEVGEDGVFPDALMVHLQLIVQGRSMPLSALSKQALSELSPFITATHPLTMESISSKIKLLAQRKSYLTGKPPAPSEKSTPISKLDCFENADECYMWRWELSSIDFLPANEVTKVKKARTMRKKLQGHYRSIINLIAAVDKAMAWLKNSSKSSTSTASAAGDKLIAKVSDMEEKVLKFEREEEKIRLLKEAKLKKQKSKAGEVAGKQHEKERLEEERRADKKRKDQEKEHKKAEAAKEREEAKRKKTEEKELKESKKKQELDEKENKRKARMMSFFSKGSVKKKQKVASNASVSLSKDVLAQVTIPSFDSDAFRKSIDSHDDEHIPTNPFSNLSSRSKASRRRKTNKVRISVFVTVLSENAFAPQPYDEERIITVPNQYKFLGFHEDVRPPYRGTWSKSSSLVTGRRPWGKDAQHLDYENDSEEEWEEGDDDEGEDLQEDGDDGADEEGDDLQNDEDNDGWLAAEDDLGIEDDDDGMTRELRKKNLTENEAPSAKRGHFKACVVAPRMGGICHENLKDVECVIEGFSPQDAMDALTLHVGCVITPDVSICLDAFPPSDPAKDTHQTKKDASGKPVTAQNKEMTTEAQIIMAKFAHNCTLKSKENLVTELLKAHPTITNSRAQAMRELDVIAEKRRLANGAGVLWEVKAVHLKKLGLKKKDLVSL